MPTDTVRHHWAPQFRPLTVSPSSASAKVILKPERCDSQTIDPLIADDQEARRKESRFFPMSAFLATPSTAIQKPSTRSANRPDLDRDSVTMKPTSSLPSGYAQDAVTSTACRALTKLAAPKCTSELPTYAESLSSANQQYSNLSSSKMTNFPASSEHQSAPLLISSPQIASPRLTLVSMDSASPGYRTSTIDVSETVHVSLPESPSSPTEKPTTFRVDGQCALQSDLGNLHSTPRSLGIASAMSPSPFVAARFFDMPKLHPVLNSGWNTASRNPFVASESTDRGPLSSSTAPVPSVDEFLRMGHANPCWCTHSPEATPPAVSRCGKSAKALESRSNGACSQTSIPPGVTHNEGNNELQNECVDISDLQDLGVLCNETSEDVPANPACESVFEFENLTASLQAAFSPNHSHEDPEEEDAWIMINAGDDRYKKPQPPPLKLEDILSEPELVSEPDIMSMPSSPSSWTLPPFDFESD